MYSCGPTEEDELARTASFTSRDVTAATEELGRLASTMRRVSMKQDQLPLPLGENAIQEVPSLKHNPISSCRYNASQSVKHRVMSNQLSALYLDGKINHMNMCIVIRWIRC